MITKTFETRNWKQNSIPVAYYQTCKASKMSQSKSQDVW